jgi:hypothetical protein
MRKWIRLSRSSAYLSFMNITVPVIVNSDLNLVLKKKLLVEGTESYSIESIDFTIDVYDKESFLELQESSTKVLGLKSSVQATQGSFNMLLILFLTSYFLGVSILCQ